jgi:DNA polymerase-3 subunit gamma/tau
VFIIDEVHMLSASSFNALLKSIEEPPPHVVFMMATTELHKIPDTVLSRSQVYEFKTISAKTVAERLRHVADAETIVVPDDALMLLARAGEGSMRDSLSAFDQVRAFAGDTMTLEDVVTVLGLVGRDLVFDMLEAVVADDAPAAFALVEKAIERGYDLRLLCRELARATRDLLVLSVDPARANDPDVAAEGERPRLAALVERSSREDLLRAFDLLTKAEQEIRTSEQPRFNLEMTLLRLMHMRQLVPIADLIAQAGSGARPALAPRPVGPSASSMTRPSAAPAAALPRPAVTRAPMPRPEPAPRSDMPRPERAGPSSERATRLDQEEPEDGPPPYGSALSPERATRVDGPPATPRPSAAPVEESPERAAPAERARPERAQPGPERAAAVDGPRPERAQPDSERAAGVEGKDAFLAEVKAARATFYNMVIAQAHRIEMTASTIVLTFLPTQKVTRAKCDEERVWLEGLAEKALGRRVAISTGVQAAAAPSPTAAPVAATRNGPHDEELRREAMADPAVQALFEIFPVEKSKIEEM